jgi:hypothetical protein
VHVALATYKRALRAFSRPHSGGCIFFEIASHGAMPVYSVDNPTPAQLTARRQLDAARQGLRDRKRLTRRKIVAGAALLAEAAHDPAFRRIVRPVLQARVTRPLDRAVIADLLDG